MESKIFYKKYILALFLEFIYGGHLLSLGASGIILSIVLLLKLPFDLNILIIAYLSSQVVYSFNHYREVKFDVNSNPERAVHILNRRTLTVFMLSIYSILLVVILFFSNLATFLFVSTIVIGGVLYTEYFKALTVGSLTGFKNFYTSLFWALSIFIIPLYYQVGFDIAYIYIFLFVFLRWIVNSAFFDIKDIESDKKRNLKTFAVLLGKNNTLYFLHFINLLSLLPIIIGIYNEALPQDVYILLAFVVYGIYYLLHASFLSGKNLRNFSYVIVDAEYLLWGILVLIFTRF